MDKWFKDILPDKDPYHNRGRDQMRKKGDRNSSACVIVQAPGVIPNPLPEVNLLMVKIPKPSFHLSIHPDHKYIWLRGGDLNH
jgi:hypothetical protein